MLISWALPEKLHPLHIYKINSSSVFGPYSIRWNCLVQHLPGNWPLFNPDSSSRLINMPGSDGSIPVHLTYRINTESACNRNYTVWLLMDLSVANLLKYTHQKTIYTNRNIFIQTPSKKWCQKDIKRNWQNEEHCYGHHLSN